MFIFIIGFGIGYLVHYTQSRPDLINKIDALLTGEKSFLEGLKNLWKHK